MLDLCLRKTWSGKSHDYRDVIVFEKLRFQIVFRPPEYCQVCEVYRSFFCVLIISDPVDRDPGKHVISVREMPTERKLNCIIYKMLFIGNRKPKPHKQCDSILVPNYLFHINI